MEPLSNSLYLDPQYWDERYKTEESYEWLLNFSELSSTLTDHLLATHKILIIGSGNSNFSEDLYLSGYTNITNIDISHTVIAKMQEKHRDKPEMTWCQMDMLDMTFDSGTFDILIDKATMDVLQCDNEDCWNPSEEVLKRVSEFYANCFKVLKPNGKLIQISFDQPHFRRKYVDSSNWSLQTSTVQGNILPYFVYTLSKLNQ